MYCTHCGKEVAGEAAFCPSCGGRQPGTATQRQLMRPLEGRKIAGVCLGFAHYLRVDPALVRIIWVIAALLPPFPAVLAYVICWIVMPNEEAAVTAPAQATSTQTQG